MNKKVPSIYLRYFVKKHGVPYLKYNSPYKGACMLFSMRYRDYELSWKLKGANKRKVRNLRRPPQGKIWNIFFVINRGSVFINKGVRLSTAVLGGSRRSIL